MCKLKIYKEMTVNNVCNVAVVVCLVVHYYKQFVCLAWE